MKVRIYSVSESVGWSPTHSEAPCILGAEHSPGLDPPCPNGQFDTTFLLGTLESFA